MVIGYIRVSTNKQDLEVQKLQIYEYCDKEKIRIDEFISLEISSRKSQEKRKIGELYEKLSEGDLLIATELSRLGRSMIEVMNLVVNLSEKGVKFVFLRQPHISTFKSPFEKVLLALFAYIDETEREFISQRTKAGLEKAKKSGKKLGRPKNAFASMYDNEEAEIKRLIVQKELPLKSIWLLLGKIGTYNNFYSYCKRRKFV